MCIGKIDKITIDGINCYIFNSTIVDELNFASQYATLVRQGTLDFIRSN